VANCHIGVLLVYATAKGRTCLARELSLPTEWAAAETRRQAADVPPEGRVATQPQVAQRRLARVLAADIPLGWLTGDTVDGHEWRVRAWLEEHRGNDGLGVSAQYRLFTGQEREWAATVGRRRPAAAWPRCSCGAGSQGERLDDGARLPWRALGGQRQRWRLARRSLRAPTDIADGVASGPQQTPLDERARGVGTRWAGEESVETATGAVGLAHDEGRSWQGWYRHLTLARFAHAYWTGLRAQAAAPEPMTPQNTRRESASATRLKH
jgi:SRSO17 transposase